MTYFEKAFNRQRNAQFTRGGRKLSDLGFILGEGLPDYLVYYTSAQQNYANGQLQSALELIDKAINLCDILDWRQYAFKANVLEDLQRYHEAIKQYEVAIDINEQDYNVYALYHQIGVCYLNLGLNEKAIAFYTYAIELKKQHPNTEFNPDLEGMDLGTMIGIQFKKMHNNRGNAFANIGKLNDAFNEAKAAIAYDQNYSNPYLLISLIYSKDGQEDKSLEFMKVSAQLGNQNALRMLQQLGYN